MTALRFFYIIIFFFLCNSIIVAQFPDRPPQDSTVLDSSRIQILHITTFKERTTPEGIFRDLIGDVHLKQKEMHLWCDLGFILPNKQIKAYDNVQMLQDDSIRVFSDSLNYDGLSRLAVLRQNVVLKDTSMTLFTDKLNYDLNSRIATFPVESIIQSDSTTMISKEGSYNLNTNIAHFVDSVRINNPNYKLTADSLDFNTQTEMAFFIGPTKVYNENKMVYCEDGYYDSQRNYAELYKNASFENYEEGKQEIAKGDTIIYDGNKDIYFLIGNAYYQNEKQEVYADTIFIDNKTEQYYFYGNPKFTGRDSVENQTIDAGFSTYDALTKTMIFRENVRVGQGSQIIFCDSLDYSSESKNGLARGHVVWQDTSADIQITCGRADYNDSTQYLLADQNPVLSTLIDRDTMWLRADTLLSFPDTSDLDIRNLKAYNNVKVFKSDLQVLCDSLFYDGPDSTFRFFINPILWVDGTQFTADTIHVAMKNSVISQVLLFNNSFILNTNDQQYFNQVKGKDVTSDFVDGDIHTMSVFLNGETVYYAVDDNDLYMGVNDVDCNNMLLYFKDNAVNRIRFEGKPAAVLYPMYQVNHKSLRLDGFRWLDSLRIKSKDEIINYDQTLLASDTAVTISTAENNLFFQGQKDSLIISLPADSSDSNLKIITENKDDSDMPEESDFPDRNKKIKSKGKTEE